MNEIRITPNTVWARGYHEPEEVVAYWFHCVYHMDNPQKHCSLCWAVNELRKQHAHALDENKKYLRGKKALEKIRDYIRDYNDRDPGDTSVDLKLIAEQALEDLKFMQDKPLRMVDRGTKHFTKEKDDG